MRRRKWYAGWTMVALALVSGITLFLIGQVHQTCGVALAGVALVGGGLWLIFYL